MVIKRTREFYEVVQRVAGRYSCWDTYIFVHIPSCAFQYMFNIYENKTRVCRSSTNLDYQGGKKHPMQQHKFTLSTVSLIEMIGTACSHWTPDHSSTTRCSLKQQGCVVTSSRIGGRNEPKKPKRQSTARKVVAIHAHAYFSVKRAGQAAAQSFKVLDAFRCIKNRSVWLPPPVASLPLDQMQYASVPSRVDACRVTGITGTRV